MATKALRRRSGTSAILTGVRRASPNTATSLPSAVTTRSGTCSRMSRISATSGRRGAISQ